MSRKATIDRIKSIIQERGYKPSDLYEPEEIKNSPAFKEFFEMLKKPISDPEVKRFFDSLGNEELKRSLIKLEGERRHRQRHEKGFEKKRKKLQKQIKMKEEERKKLKKLDDEIERLQIKALIASGAKEVKND